MNAGAAGGGSTGVDNQIAMVVGSPGGGLSGGSDDDDDNCPSSPGSAYEEGTDLMAAAMGDEVTAQLAAAGMSIQLSSHMCHVSNLYRMVTRSGRCSCRCCHCLRQEKTKTSFFRNEPFHTKETAKQTVTET